MISIHDNLMNIYACYGICECHSMILGKNNATPISDVFCDEYLICDEFECTHITIIILWWIFITIWWMFMYCHGVYECCPLILKK